MADHVPIADIEKLPSTSRVRAVLAPSWMRVNEIVDLTGLSRKLTRSTLDGLADSGIIERTHQANGNVFFRNFPEAA